MATVATIKRMGRQTLSEKLLKEDGPSNMNIAVVDVRDYDYIGGHIKSSINIPCQQLDALLPTLCRQLKDTKTVVFHCMLSQQRGPFAALKYIRERDEILKKLGEEGLKDSEQEVYLLERGFHGWQEIFGNDEKLTEGYVKDLWE